jgi:hypothetical protein
MMEPMNQPEENLVDFPVPPGSDAVFREIEDLHIGPLLELAQQGDERAIAEVQRRTEAGDFDV